MKQIIKKIIPRYILYKLQTFYWQWQSRGAKAIFEQAGKSPNWLSLDELETLQEKYAYPPEYGYDAVSLETRGKDRAEKILNLIKKSEIESLNNFLEIGCFDGMVSSYLQKQGKTTTAVDDTDEGFNNRAKSDGVKFLKMNASHLQFADNSFDFIFSFNALEHFADPAKVLQEAVRVLKKGGYIYLDFGPIYMAPMGLHAYRSITVPYCQFLFSKEVLEEFVKIKKLKPINFSMINGWTLEDYRNLWLKYTNQLKPISYFELSDISNLDLIMQYPSCFKSKTEYFDNLIISNIEVLFKKI